MSSPPPRLASLTLRLGVFRRRCHGLNVLRTRAQERHVPLGVTVVVGAGIAEFHLFSMTTAAWRGRGRVRMVPPGRLPFPASWRPGRRCRRAQCVVEGGVETAHLSRIVRSQSRPLCVNKYVAGRLTYLRRGMRHAQLGLHSLEGAAPPQRRPCVYSFVPQGASRRLSGRRFGGEEPRPARNVR